MTPDQAVDFILRHFYRTWPTDGQPLLAFSLSPDLAASLRTFCMRCRASSLVVGALEAILYSECWAASHPEVAILIGTTR